MAKEIIKSVQELAKKKEKPILAYYMKEKNGGYEVYQVHIEESVVLENKRISDPDAWDQSVVTLESYLSMQFQ